jgi:fatty-acid desaturase
MVNNRMLNNEDISRIYPNVQWEKMDKNLFQFIATFIQVCISFLIGKFLFGRRIQIIYVVLAFNAVLEIYFAMYSFRGNGQQQEIFLIKSTLVFLLYFMVCQLGVIDIAKI